MRNASYELKAKRSTWLSAPSAIVLRQLDLKEGLKLRDGVDLCLVKEVQVTACAHWSDLTLTCGATGARLFEWSNEGVGSGANPGASGK